MNNQHQIHHRVAEKAGDTQHQLNALFNDPSHALTSAFHNPSGHVLTLVIVLVVALLAIWIASGALGGFGKMLMPAPSDKRSLYTGSYEAGNSGTFFVIAFMKYAAAPMVMFALFYFIIGPQVQQMIVGMPTG